MTGALASKTAPAGDAAKPLLDRPVRAVGVSGQMASKLRALHIDDVRDLLFHLPRRYDDFSRPMTLRQLREQPIEGPVSATVEVVDLRVEQGFRRRVQRTVARIRDETGEGEAVWFGRRYVERRLHVVVGLHPQWQRACALDGERHLDSLRWHCLEDQHPIPPPGWRFGRCAFDRQISHRGGDVVPSGGGSNIAEGKDAYRRSFWWRR